MNQVKVRERNAAIRLEFDVLTGSAMGLSSVPTALLLLLVPPMAFASCAALTSPGAPGAPSCPRGMPKLKCTAKPSNQPLTHAGCPEFRVVTESSGHIS